MSRVTKDILSGRRQGYPPPPSQQTITDFTVVASVPSNATPSRRRVQSDGGDVDNMPEPQKLDHFIGILKEKLVKQKSELDVRTDNVNAIQRNFERLSEMYASDRDKHAVAQAIIDKQSKELDDLRAQLKVNSVVRIEIQNLHAQMEMLVQKHAGESRASGEEIIALRKNRALLEGEKQEASEALHALQTTHAEVARAQKLTQDEISSAERACNQLLESMLLVHQVVGLTPPLCGDGIAFVRDTSGCTNPSRVMGLRTSLATAVSRALPPVLAKVESMKSAHSATSASVGAEVKGLRKELGEANMNAHNARARVAEVERMLSEVGGKLGSEAQMAKEKESLVAGLKVRVGELEGLVNVTGAQREASQGELAEMKKKWEDAQRCLVTQQQDLAEWRDKVGELRHSVQNKDTELEKMRAGLDRKVGEVGMTWEKRQKEWEEKSAKREALRKRELEEDAVRMANVSQEVTMLTQQIAVLRRQLVEKEAVSAEVAKLKLQIKEATDARISANELKSKLDESLKSAASWEAKYREASEALVSSSANAAQGHEAWKGELEGIRKEMEERVKNLTSQLFDANRLSDVHKALCEKEQVRAEGLEKQMGHWKSKADGNAVDIAQLAKAKDEVSVALHIATQKLDFARAEEASAKILVKKFEAEKQTLQTEKEAMAKNVAALRMLQEETARTVRKLLAAEEACESGYSCMSCLGVMKDPVLCSPCGHSYCRQCLVEQQIKKGAKFCVECDKYSVSDVVPSRALDLLSGKFLYRKQVLNDLIGVLAAQVERRGSTSTTV